MSESNEPTTSPAAATEQTANDAATLGSETTPEPKESSSSTATLCKFQIKNIAYAGDISADEFDVILNPNMHGIYDLIDAVFEHSLTALTTEGWTIESRLWTTDYGNKNFVSHVDEDFLDLYDKKPYLCSGEKCWVFKSSEMEKLVGFKKGTKGFFSLDHKPLKFQFSLVDVNVPIDDTNKGAVEEPQCVAAVSKITYTADKKAEFVTVQMNNAIVALADKYTEFYGGMNAWSRERSLGVWIPAYPQHPVWSSDEIKIIALFLKGGWKFANSWKYGLQYAFPHRSKSATQGKWYSLNKNSWEIEYHGKNLSKDECIIRAKKMCKDFMEDLLEQGPPKAQEKPMSMSMLREEMMKRSMDAYDPDDDPDSDLRYTSGYVAKQCREAHIPKRLRTSRF